MATEPAELRNLQDPPAVASRSQAVQRLQVGLFGLAAMILLVGLANIIMTNARQNQAQVTPASSASAVVTDTSATDPLADAGVVPDMAGAPDPAVPNASATAGP